MTLLVAEFQQTTSYPMRRFRRAYQMAGGSQPGFFSMAGMDVTVSTMTLTISAGSALLSGTAYGTEGLYHVENDANVNLTVTAANATNPRIDQVILTLGDTTDIAGSAGNTATLSLLDGTPTAGATLRNRTGAAALPAGALRLADILVPAAAGSLVTGTHIAPRKLSARGALYMTRDPGVANDNSNGATAQTAPVALAASPTGKLTQNVLRAELSGNPVMFRAQGQALLKVLGVGATTPISIGMVPAYSQIAASTGTGGGWAAMGPYSRSMTLGAVSQEIGFEIMLPWVPPAAGIYLIGMWFYPIGSLGTTPITEVEIRNTPSGTDLEYSLEELVMPFSTNRLT